MVARYETKQSDRNHVKNTVIKGLRLCNMQNHAKCKILPHAILGAKSCKMQNHSKRKSM